MMLAAFVVAYSIQAIVWLFVYCVPFSGWWLFQWANPLDPRCKSFTVFVNLMYWNVGESLSSACLVLFASRHQPSSKPHGALLT